MTDVDERRRVGDAAYFAGLRLRRAATALLTVVSVIATVGVLAGIWMVFGAQAAWIRRDGAVLAIGTAALWLTTVIPCLGLQAAGWYVQFKSLD